MSVSLYSDDSSAAGRLDSFLFQNLLDMHERLMSGTFYHGFCTCICILYPVRSCDFENDKKFMVLWYEQLVIFFVFVFLGFIWQISIYIYILYDSISIDYEEIFRGFNELTHGLREYFPSVIGSTNLKMINVLVYRWKYTLIKISQSRSYSQKVIVVK